MNTTVKSLQDLYVKMGGSLTDTYEGISDGAAVGNYTTIPDMIEAVTQKAGQGGGEGGDGNPVLPLLLLKSFEPQSFEDDGTTYYCLGIRTNEQLVKGGMDNLTISGFDSLSSYWAGNNQTYHYLSNIFDSREQPWYQHVWHNTDTLLAICAIEVTDPYDLWKQVADAMYATEPDESGWDIRIQSAKQALSEYLKTADIEEAISPYIPQTTILALQGTLPTGETSISTIDTIYAVSFTVSDFVNMLEGFYNSIVQFFTEESVEVGRQSVQFFVSIDNTDPDNTVYTIGFHFFDGASMRLASFTGGLDDTVVFTVATAT